MKAGGDAEAGPSSSKASKPRRAEQGSRDVTPSGLTKSSAEKNPESERKKSAAAQKKPTQKQLMAQILEELAALKKENVDMKQQMSKSRKKKNEVGLLGAALQ